MIRNDLLVAADYLDEGGFLEIAQALRVINYPLLAWENELVLNTQVSTIVRLDEQNDGIEVLSLTIEDFVNVDFIDVRLRLRFDSPNIGRALLVYGLANYNINPHGVYDYRFTPSFSKKVELRIGTGNEYPVYLLVAEMNVKGYYSLDK